MRVKLLIVFVFTVLLAFPQSNANTQLKDSLTYQAYLQKDWNKLIEIGKECINQGVQFEFLDLRMGIAYYEKKNYRKAIKYFENALADEVYPETTAEYLYYAY